MLSAPGPSPHVLYGQGRSVSTLLTEGGYHCPVISQAYTDRVQSAPYEHGRGVRAMHKSTLTIAKPPWKTKEAYTTSNKQDFSGSKSLNPVRRPPLCPSMHRSQWEIAHKNQVDRSWKTHYKGTFIEKDIVPANRSHLTSLVNRIDQTEGGDVRDTLKMDKESPNYFSQYNRVHNKLGAVLGPGVPLSYPVRTSYNVITGEEIGPAWKSENRRISGNRVLFSNRSSSNPFVGH